MRALQLLAQCPDTCIPYNFLRIGDDPFVLREEGVGPDPTRIRSELHDILQRGSHVFSFVQQGLEAERMAYEKEVAYLLHPYPHLQNLMYHDTIILEDLARRFALRAGSKLTKLTFHESLDQGDEEEGDTTEEDLHEVLGFFKKLATITALRKMSFPGRRLDRIIGTCVGFAGFIVVSQIYGLLTHMISPYVEPAVSLTMVALLFAPILEEFYKVITVRVTHSALPAYVTFLLEFVAYTFALFQAERGPTLFSDILFLIVGILGRVYSLEMHMTTTDYYIKDARQFGKVRFLIYLSGTVMHMLWNFAIILVNFVGATRGFLNRTLDISLKIVIARSLSSIFDQYFQWERGDREDEEPPSPPPRQER